MNKPLQFSSPCRMEVAAVFLFYGFPIFYTPQKFKLIGEIIVSSTNANSTAVLALGRSHASAFVILPLHNNPPDVGMILHQGGILLLSGFTGSVQGACGDKILCRWSIKYCVPNSRKDDTNEKENKSRYKNMAVVALFGRTKLTLTVIGIFLVPCSSHRDKGKHNVSEDESDADQCTLAADVQHAREKRHQYARDEERV